MRTKAIVVLVFFHVSFIALTIWLGTSGFFSWFEWPVYLAGFFQASWGQIYFTVVKGWRGVNTTKAQPIWDRGPFAIVRHPFYGGMLIMMAVVQASIIRHSWRMHNFDSYLFIGQGFILLVMFFLFIARNSISQERELRRTHKKKAEQYFAQVRRRWIPFVF